MTETLGYAISKTWYIVLFLLLLLLELHSFPKRNHLKFLLRCPHFAWYLAWGHLHLVD